MSSISSLSAGALYAKAKACCVAHLSDSTYAELAELGDLNEFAAYLKSKTAYAAAFEGIGGSGRLTRLHLEAIIKRMTLISLEKLIHYAALGDNYVKDYFLAEHECECIVNRLRQSRDYTIDSYFLYLPDGFWKKTSFDLAALERAHTLEEIAAVLAGTHHQARIERLLTNRAESAGEANGAGLLSENVLYADLYESSAAQFKKKLSADEYAEVRKLLALFSDMITVDTLYRIKKYYGAYGEALKLYIYKSELTRFSAAQRERLVHAEDLPAFFEALEKTCYKALVPLLRGNRAPVAVRQYRWNVCRKLFAMSAHPAVSALCYGILMRTQADNLITLAEGVAAGADKAQMLDLLIR